VGFLKKVPLQAFLYTPRGLNKGTILGESMTVRTGNILVTLVS